MTRYILDRLVQSALVLLVMSFVIYGLIGLMPGDPVDLMISADPKMTAADAARNTAPLALSSAGFTPGGFCGMPNPRSIALTAKMSFLRRTASDFHVSDSEIE